MYQLYEEYREKQSFRYDNISYCFILMSICIYYICLTNNLMAYTLFLYFIIIPIFTFGDKAKNMFIEHHEKYNVVFELIGEGHFFVDLSQNDMYHILCEYYYNYYDSISQEVFLKFFRMYGIEFMKDSVRLFRINKHLVNEEFIKLLNTQIDLKK